MQAPTIEDLKEARKRIQDYVIRTPCLPSNHLGKLTNKRVYLKAEMLQLTGSFKTRGAANCILANMDTAKKRGVVAASAGNHAQGVASVCQKLGISATIVMPKPTPTIKVQNTKRYGAAVELVGDVYEEAYDHACTLADEKGLLFVHPYQDPLTIAGQGTVGLEISEEPWFDQLEAVVCSVGGGGLISGVAIALKTLNPKIKIYGVAAKNAPANWKSFHEKKPCDTPVSFTIAEGVATKRADKKMLPILSHYLDDFFVVEEGRIASSIALLAEYEKLVTEGAGALPVAPLLDGQIKEKMVCLILSGGNIDPPTLSRVLQRGLVEQGRLVRLDITVNDRPGGLAAITKLLADHGTNVVSIHHQRESLVTPFGLAKIEFTIETKEESHTQQVIDSLKQAHYEVERLS